MIPWRPEDFPEARFLGVFMRPVLMGFAPRACLERGRRCEMLDTATLLKAYPLATRRLLANRGNNTIVRMRQHRTVVAIPRAICRRAPARGPPGSSDGTKIWVTVTGHLAGAGYLVGAVLELPRF